MLAFMRSLEGTALFKKVWFHTFPMELWKQVATVGLTGLDEIAKRADLIQESLKLEKLAAVSASQRSSASSLCRQQSGQLGGMDPKDERDKSFLGVVCLFPTLPLE